MTYTHDYILDRIAIGPYTSRTSDEFAGVITCMSKAEIDDLDLENKYPVGLTAGRAYVMIEDGGTGLKENIPYILTFIRGFIKSRPVLVHCGAGMSRSVSVVIAYLVSCGFSVADAKSFVCDRRKSVSHVAPYHGFLDEIKEYFKIQY